MNPKDGDKTGLTSSSKEQRNKECADLEILKQRLQSKCDYGQSDTNR